MLYSSRLACPQHTVLGAASVPCSPVCEQQRMSDTARSAEASQ